MRYESLVFGVNGLTLNVGVRYCYIFCAALKKWAL